MSSKAKKVMALLFAVFIILYFIKEQSNIVYTWKTWHMPLSGKIIVIDPGHGGPDGGAQREGVIEKEIALNISRKLRDYIQGQGGIVIMTRETDIDLAKKHTTGYSNRKAEDLRKRIKVINHSDADLFLSIHLNSLPQTRYSGAQTFYALGNEDNKRLAISIQSELKSTLKNTERAARPIHNLFLLRRAKVPGALVEVGFLSNTEERNLLVSKKYQDKIAVSIYKGIMRYYSKDVPSK